MADDPTTVINNDTIEIFKTAQEEMRKCTTRLEELKASGSATAAEIKNAERALEQAKEKLSALTSKAGIAGLVMSDLALATNSVKSQFGPLGDVLSNITNKISGGLIDAFGKYGQVIATMGSRTYGNLINPLNDGSLSVFGLSKSLTNLNTAISKLRETQTTARVATILFSNSMENADESIRKASRVASEYPQALRRSSVATGITTNKLEEMNRTMQIVPGSMRLVQDGIAGIADTQRMAVQPTAVLATVSKAFGMTTAQAATMGAEAWKNFGQTTEETIRQMGLMSDAARQTGVDRRTAREQIQEASGSLAIFGQRTAAAAGTWTTFMTSLRGAGVPIREVGRIVNSVTQSIAGMSVQHRAFIGMMSGLTQGRTALGGALQLELAMRSPEGMQRNLQSLTSTLAQFAGGKIITIEEAARNPQLEMQFQLQRQMLGKLTNITSQEQQNRVLETLQNVQRGGMSQVEGGKELDKAFKEGKSVQEKQLTVLQRIEQGLRATFGQAADRQLEDLDEATRNLGDLGRPLGGVAAMMRNLSMASTTRPIAGTVEGQRAMEALGQQFRHLLPAYRERVTRRGGEPTRNLTGLISSLGRGLFGDFERTFNVRARQPRLPAGEATPTTVPLILGAGATPRRGVVPEVRRPTTTRTSRTPEVRRPTRIETGRIENRKLQIMTDLLNNVKSMNPTERGGVVPEALLTRPGATAPGVAVPTIATERAGTTSTIVVKITDEGRTEASSKIHNDIITSINKSVLGIRD